MENYLFYAPRHVKPYKIQPELIGRFRPVNFVSNDNVKLFGWYFNVENSQQVIIYCHGQAESMTKWQNVAKFLTSKGISVLMLSFRGGYKSAATPSEQGVYLDLQAAINYLKQNGYKESDIIAWGRSIGASPSIRLASNHNIKGLIVESGFDSIKNATISMSYFYCKKLGLLFLFPLLKSRIEASDYLQKFDNLQMITNIKCPAFIAHSKEDGKIHCASALALKKANKSVKLFMSKTGSHNENDWCLNEVYEFITSLN